MKNFLDGYIALGEEQMIDLGDGIIYFSKNGVEAERFLPEEDMKHLELYFGRDFKGSGYAHWFMKDGFFTIRDETKNVYRSDDLDFVRHILFPETQIGLAGGLPYERVKEYEPYIRDKLKTLGFASITALLFGFAGCTQNTPAKETPASNYTLQQNMTVIQEKHDLAVSSMDFEKIPETPQSTEILRTEPLKPIAEYLQKNGINLDQEVVDNLEASGLTENNKEFLDLYKNFYPPYLTEKLPIKEISIDGVSSTELAFMNIASKTNDDKYFPTLTKILYEKPSVLEKLDLFDDKKTEQILSVFGDYVTNMQINYLKTALDIDMEDVAFDPRFNGEGYSAQFDEERLLLYKNFTSLSENFEKMSLDAQIFILETEWSKQNKTSSENIAYINTISITFNPNDKTKDSDGGGIFDIEEIKRMGDILSTVDDANLRMKYEIIKNGPFLTVPHFLGDMTLYSYYDLDTKAGLRNVRNYRGDRNPCDGPNKPGTCPDHPGIDYKCEVGTPVLAAAPGIIIRAGTNPDGAIVIIIDHLNGFYTEYGHLDRITLSKNEVARGEEIGLCGNSGKNSAFAHLHFELRNTIIYSATDYYYGTVDPYRDELNPNSKSYWINGNDPLYSTRDGKFKTKS